MTVTIIKFSGLLLLAGLWYFFYTRERKWWQFSLCVFGILAAAVQVSPGISRYGDNVAGGYVAIVIVLGSTLYNLGYRPKRPIRLWLGEE